LLVVEAAALIMEVVVVLVVLELAVLLAQLEHIQ
jgi:hypothetical protein